MSVSELMEALGLDEAKAIRLSLVIEDAIRLRAMRDTLGAEDFDLAIRLMEIIRK